MMNRRYHGGQISSRTDRKKGGPIKVGLLVIATGKYKRFVEPFVISAQNHFFKNDAVTIFLFSDKPRHDLPVFNIHLAHKGFPDMTLYRYNYFYDAKEKLLDMSHYLYYSDIDMLFVEDVDKETLPETDDHIVAVKHPGFWKGGGTWETRIESRAYVSPDQRLCYYAGGFNGAESYTYIGMCRKIAEDVLVDKKRQITAIWHDESHFNKFIIGKPITELSPSYCSPQGDELWKTQVRSQFKPKILALLKDHEEVRKE